MQDINWIQVGASLIGGGLAGAFIKQFFDNRRNRIQPVSYETQLRSVYNSGDNKLLPSQIILNEGKVNYMFSKLYTGDLQIYNSGLHDYSEFTFGLTLPSTMRFVQAIPSGNDRHHAATLTSVPSLENQISSFDVTLKPFNRKDPYTIQFLATTEDEQIDLENILISSAHPVKLVPMRKDMSELLSLWSGVPLVGPTRLTVSLARLLISKGF